MDPLVLSSIILGGAGVIITGIFSWLRHKIEHDRMMKELFTEFNSRYDKLNAKLYKIKKKEDESDQEHIYEIIKDSKLEDAIIDFLNLCAEEYYWSKKNRIDKNIWKSWHSGMNYWYNSVATIRYVWDEKLKIMVTSLII